MERKEEMEGEGVRVTVITTTSLGIIELTLNIDWHAKRTTSFCVCTLTNIKLSISNHHHLQNILTDFARENLRYNHGGPHAKRSGSFCENILLQCIFL